MQYNLTPPLSCKADLAELSLTIWSSMIYLFQKKTNLDFQICR